MSVLVPRIRGRAFKDTEVDAWRYEILIQIGEESEENQPLSAVSKEKFINRQTAIARMHHEIPDLVKMVCKIMGLGEPVDLLNLKTNRTESFESFQKSGLPKSLQK